MFQEVLGLLILLLAALFGWYVFSKLKISTPQFMGPLAVVSCLNCLNVSLPALNPYVNDIAQIFIGYYLGSNITLQYIQQAKKFLLTILLTAFWSLLITLLFGYLIAFTMPLDLGTGILSSSPGGLPEVGVIALAVQANIPVITMMHLTRMVIIMVLIPLFIKVLKLKNPVAVPEKTDNVRSVSLVLWHNKSFNLIREGLCLQAASIIAWLYNFTPVISAVGGILFNMLHIPAGFMLGGMLGVVLVTLGGRKVEPLPEGLFSAALLVIGIFIGMQFTQESLTQLSELYPYVILFNFLILLASVGLALIIQRVTGWKLLTCLLASAPGALFLMVAIASEMDSEPFKVSLLHITRLFTVKATLPFIALFFR